MTKHFFCVLLCILAFSCTVDKEVPYPPELIISVKDTNNLAIPKAAVFLYDDIDAWYAKENELKQDSTNDQGTVVFKNLESKIYYVFVSKDSLSNQHGIAKTSDSLKLNEIRTLEIVIDETE